MKLAVQYHLCCDGWVLGPVDKVTQESVDLQKLTKNEASRLIDLLLVNFRRSRPS